MPSLNAGRSICDQEDGSEYEIEAGDIAFDAAPVDLHRRLRRIFDNARITVEERGVTTLHLSFGVLRWEDPLLGSSVSPLWLVPCVLENRGPSAPLQLSPADDEALFNPALALFLRERHRVDVLDLPADVSTTTLGVYLDAVQEGVRDAAGRWSPRCGFRRTASSHW